MFTIALWVMACGPAAPSAQDGGAAVDPTTQAADIAQGVQMLNASSGDRGSSQAGSVRNQAPTAIAETGRIADLHTGDGCHARDCAPNSRRPPFPQQSQCPYRPRPQRRRRQWNYRKRHPRTFMPNCLRRSFRSDAEMSEFPRELEPGLEADAHIYADGGAWNTGLRVESLHVVTTICGVRSFRQ